MAITISQVAEIARNINEADVSVEQGKQSIEQNKLDKQAAFDKNETNKLFFTDENSKVNSYQNERRWLDGTTYTPITYSQVDAAAQRADGNIFYTSDWTKFTPKLPTSGNGNPTSNSANSENNVLNDTFDNNGLLALTSFIQATQTGASDTLRLDYSGGTSLEADLGNQTPGKFLLAHGGGNSALLRVVSVTPVSNPSPPPTNFYTVAVEVIVATSGTIPSGSTITESFTFSNADRNDPSSTSYENVLLGLFALIEASVNLWNTSITNQLTELNGNLDNNPDIATAIADTTNAQSVISTWLALPNTGSTGSDSKYTDNNLANIESEAADRNTFRGVRVPQITGRLGTVSQDSQGKVTGNGIYKVRFDTIGLMINTLNGPLAQYYSLDIGASIANVQIDSSKTKKSIFTSKVLVSKFAVNPSVVGPTVTVVDATGFSVSDVIVVVGTNLDNIVATITNINGNDITISKDIPLTYNADANAGIAKAK